jgi:PKD repeat protein
MAAGHDTILKCAINQILNITEEIPAEYLRASFTVDTTMGRGELTVQFKDLSRTDPAHPVTSWTWDFNGDGIEDSNLQNPVHTFTNPMGEVFDVSLVISNGTHTDTITRQDFIQLYHSMSENLAQWAMATASALEHPIFIAQNAVDGEMLSRWSSNATDTEWLKIEMDSIYTIGKVIIQWEAAYGSGYMVSVSKDDTNGHHLWPKNSR